MLFELGNKYSEKEEKYGRKPALRWGDTYLLFLHSFCLAFEYWRLLFYVIFEPFLKVKPGLKNYVTLFLSTFF